MKIKELKNKKGVFNILVIGIALFIIINNFLFVSAEENVTLSTTFNTIEYLLNIEGYNESDLYNENLICRFGQSSYTDSLDINAFNNMILPVISGAYSDYNYILCSDINNTYSLFLVDKDVKLFNSASGLTFVGFTSDINNSIIYHSSYDSSYNFVSTTTYNFSIDSSVNPSYSYYNYSGAVILSSSGDIYISNYVNTNAIYNVSYAYSCLLNYDSSYIFENANYTYDFPSSVYPDGSGGTSANNLYLDGAQITFNCPSYWGVGQFPDVIAEQPTYNWGNGSARFEANLNQFQINNLSDFNLDYIFQIKMSGTCTALYQDDLNFYGSFGPYTVTQSLTDFYHHGSMKSFNMSDLFENCHNVYPGAFNLNDTVYDAINVIDNYEEINNFQWQIQVTVKLESNNQYSGGCKSIYDFINKTMTTYDTSIHNNDNPFVDDDGLPTNSTDDSSSSSVSGGNSLVNNDNDIINLNGNGEVAQELVDDLLPEDSDAGLSNQLQETLNQNGWLPVVQSVFSFVPIGVWSTIEIYVVSCLGILAAFFVLRLVLDLL